MNIINIIFSIILIVIGANGISILYDESKIDVPTYEFIISLIILFIGDAIFSMSLISLF